MHIGKRSQVGTLVSFGILKVPSLHGLAVKVIDNDLEVVFGASKHVAGAVENDLFGVFENDLIQLAAGCSGVGANSKTRIARPLLRILEAEDSAEHVKTNLAVVGERSFRMQHRHLNSYSAIRGSHLPLGTDSRRSSQLI